MFHSNALARPVTVSPLTSLISQEKDLASQMGRKWTLGLQTVLEDESMP